MIRKKTPTKKTAPPAEASVLAKVLRAAPRLDPVQRRELAESVLDQSLLLAAGAVAQSDKRRTGVSAGLHAATQAAALLESLRDLKTDSENWGSATCEIVRLSYKPLDLATVRRMLEAAERRGDLEVEMPVDDDGRPAVDFDCGDDIAEEVDP
jgi:hypothetical protein